MVFSDFSLRNTRKESSLECIFIDDYATYLTFSLSFPGFSVIIKDFPEILTFFQIP